MQEEQNRPKEDSFCILLLLQSKEGPPLISIKGEIKYKSGNQRKIREFAHEFIFLRGME